MLTIKRLAYAIEWRNKADRRWVPAVVCDRHVQALMQLVPVRVTPERKEYPIDQCCMCQAEQKRKGRRLLEGRIENSLIRDGLCLSERIQNPFK